MSPLQRLVTACILPTLLVAIASCGLVAAKAFADLLGDANLDGTLDGSDYTI